MEMLIELLGEFLWALCKDAIMLFIITKLKEWWNNYRSSDLIECY
jgi:hypothetical protein